MSSGGLELLRMPHVGYWLHTSPKIGWRNGREAGCLTPDGGGRLPAAMSRVSGRSPPPQKKNQKPPPPPLLRWEECLHTSMTKTCGFTAQTLDQCRGAYFRPRRCTSIAGSGGQPNWDHNRHATVLRNGGGYGPIASFFCTEHRVSRFLVLRAEPCEHGRQTSLHTTKYGNRALRARSLVPQTVSSRCSPSGSNYILLELVCFQETARTIAF